jgi:hypothetical protein
MDRNKGINLIYYCVVQSNMWHRGGGDSRGAFVEGGDRRHRISSLSICSKKKNRNLFHGTEVE